MLSLEAIGVASARNPQSLIGHQLSILYAIATAGGTVSYTAFADLVERGLVLIMSDIAKTAEDFEGCDEDAVTGRVVSNLKFMGFGAWHDAFVNGHCDVTVEFAPTGFLWLGEAKKDHGHDKVWGGFLQLTERYSTGRTNENRSGMLIYCFDPKSNKFMQDWRTHLDDEIAKGTVQGTGATVDDTVHQCGAFRSTVTSPKDGGQLETLHMATSLHFDPRDRNPPKLTPKKELRARAAKKP